LSQHLVVAEVSAQHFTKPSEGQAFLVEDNRLNGKQGVNQRTDPDGGHASVAVTATAFHHVFRLGNAVVKRRGEQRTGVVPPTFPFSLAAPRDEEVEHLLQVAEVLGIQFVEIRAAGV
jgi:hypothetical protein